MPLKSDTLLITRDGLKQAKDIKIGDLVFTHKGKFSRVININKSYYLGNLVKFRTRGTSEKQKWIVLTPEHKILVIRNNELLWMPIIEVIRYNRYIAKYGKDQIKLFFPIYDKFYKNRYKLVLQGISSIIGSDVIFARYCFVYNIKVEGNYGICTEYCVLESL